MDKDMENHKVEQNGKRPNWILMVCMSPIAILVLIFMILRGLLRLLYRASLLFIIVVINTPFTVMYSLSLLVFQCHCSKDDHLRLLKKIPVLKNYSSDFDNLLSSYIGNSRWKVSDPRASVGIEVQVILSDFFKVVAADLLLVLSTGIITYYTAPLLVFYISTGVWLVAILHRWLNTPSLSKTALSCLCGGYGLNPIMFFFSFIGFFSIGCHPVAKCSFVATHAFVIVKDDHKQSNQLNKEDGQYTPKGPKGINNVSLDIEASRPQDEEVGFNRELINWEKPTIIPFKWNAFERGLFQLNPKIQFKEKMPKNNCGNKSNKECGYVLKSFMELKLRDKVICNYPVERLELPEDYSKINELYNFLKEVSDKDGFVTDKLGGRYEHSLTLFEIAEEVEKNVRYKIVDPIEEVFVVA